MAQAADCGKGGVSMACILLVDDDSVDAMAVRRALRDLRIENKLEVARDGQEALSILGRTPASPPRFVLLDLNMPRMGGLEFLREVKRGGPHRAVPIVVLTTSDAEQDRVKSIDLGADGYVVKPFDYRDFLKSVKEVCDRWS
jgi:CheY-like chemotaxis protein